jgi:hypothetical protein
LNSAHSSYKGVPTDFFFQHPLLSFDFKRKIVMLNEYTIEGSSKERVNELKLKT